MYGYLRVHHLLLPLILFIILLIVSIAWSMKAKRVSTLSSISSVKRFKWPALIGLILIIGLGLLIIFQKKLGMGQKSQSNNAVSYLNIIPSQNTSSRFPTISLNYIWGTSINSSAVSYQMADYDSKNNQVLFYPYGTSGTGKMHIDSGVLLSYHPGNGSFTDLSNWRSADLSQIVGPNAIDFGGGFLDSSTNYAYLPPLRKFTNGKTSRNGETVKVNLSKEYINPNDPSAYESFDISSLPGISEVGSFAGVFGNGYAYYAPTFDFSDGNWHGAFVRYNSLKSFSDQSAWQWYNINNLTTPADTSLGGMQSMAFKSPFVYLIPFINGNFVKGQTGASKLVRYDSTKDFQSASSYQVFDLKTLSQKFSVDSSQLAGFTGGINVGNSLLFVPSSNTITGAKFSLHSTSIALLFDTTNPNLSDLAAWQAIDLTKVNPLASGYQFGWLDKDGFVFFVPTRNSTIEKAPPFIVWNSHLPFSSPSSWTSYNNPVSIWSTGAAYDPNTNTAWFAPYGAGQTSGSARITQLQEKY